MMHSIEVAFHGANLLVVDHNNQPYVPMKPVVAGMGLDWKSQHVKLSANQTRWGMVEIAIPTASGVQRMTCLPLRKLPGWLSTIHPRKVRAELRDKIIAYQNEADDVLWNAWQQAEPSTPYAVLPGQALTAEQAQTLRMMLTHAVARMPYDQRKDFIVQGWSKLKAHFKVSYRDIPQHEFNEAVAILSRHCVEWESTVPFHGRQRLITIIENGQIVSMTPVDPAAVILPPARWANAIKTADVSLPPPELANLLEAVSHKVTRQLAR